MKKYRKKPIVVEAIQWTGENIDEVNTWEEETSNTRDMIFFPDGKLVIMTLKGDMTADPNDWIISGVKGEIYPCKPDIFAMTYEEVV